MVGTTGFEPATSSVSRKRSNQLSYAPAKVQEVVYQDRGRGGSWGCRWAKACCTIVIERLGSDFQAKHISFELCIELPGLRNSLGNPIPAGPRGKLFAWSRHRRGPVNERAMTDAPNARLNPFRTAPNLLTFLRICMAPFLVAAILERHFTVSFGLFIAAGLTDALDGMLARLLKQRSQLGEYLDPVADKLLLSTLFLVLTHMGLIPARVTVLVFGRDAGILMVAAILYAAVGRREFIPSLLGKANTLVQVSAVAVVLLCQLTSTPWVADLRTAFLDATMALTAISGLHYAWTASRRVGAQPVGDHSDKRYGNHS
jgi:cardiolipin synthase (CMP-forming)